MHSASIQESSGMLKKFSASGKEHLLLSLLVVCHGSPPAWAWLAILTHSCWCMLYGTESLLCSAQLNTNGGEGKGRVCERVCRWYCRCVHWERERESDIKTKWKRKIERKIKRKMKSVSVCVFVRERKKESECVCVCVFVHVEVLLHITNRAPLPGVPPFSRETDYQPNPGVSCPRSRTHAWHNQWPLYVSDTVGIPTCISKSYLAILPCDHLLLRLNCSMTCGGEEEVYTASNFHEPVKVIMWRDSSSSSWSVLLSKPKKILNKLTKEYCIFVDATGGTVLVTKSTVTWSAKKDALRNK